MNSTQLPPENDPEVSDLAQKLESFIRDRFDIADEDRDFTRQVDLWEHGYVDSAGVLEVLHFLEEKVGESLPEDLLFEPSFTTIDGMAQHSTALRR